MKVILLQLSILGVTMSVENMSKLNFKFKEMNNLTFDQISKLQQLFNL